MRIVIATPLYPPQLGGPAKYAVELEREFVRQGHHARVVAYGALERALPMGLRHAVYFLRLLPHAWGSSGIVALDTWSVGLPALLAARIADRKLIVRIAGDFLWEAYVARTGKMMPLSLFNTQEVKLSLKERLIYRGTRYFVRHADALAFTTRWQLELWHKKYGFNKARAHMIENFYPTPGTPSQVAAKVFVAAGRDIALKNKHGLREAFAQVKQAHPTIELDERVLPPESHAARLGGAYAVVVSSISEVNPNTAIEAAAARKPFIAPSDCGGKERLQGMGLFVNTAEPQELKAALEQLLNPVVYQRCIDASATLAPHSWSDIAHAYAMLMPRI